MKFIIASEIEERRLKSVKHKNIYKNRMKVHLGMCAWESLEDSKPTDLYHSTDRLLSARYNPSIPKLPQAREVCSASN